MRAREFLKESGRDVTINIPITIKIPHGNGDVEVDAANVQENHVGNELPPEPVYVFPLQQQLEIEKHKVGKRSRVLNQILDDNGAWGESVNLDVGTNFDSLAEEYQRLNSNDDTDNLSENF